MEGQHSPALTWHTRNDSLTLSPHTRARATPPTSQPHLSSAYTGTLTHLNQALHGPLPKDPAMFSVRVNWGRRSQRQSSQVLGGGSGRGEAWVRVQLSRQCFAPRPTPPRPVSKCTVRGCTMGLSEPSSSVSDALDRSRD